MRNRLRIIIVGLCLCWSGVTATAQRQITPLQSGAPLSYFLPALSYNPAIPTPEEFFGFPVGGWHLRPDQVVDYLKALAAKTPRLTLDVYGSTYEHRPLVLAVFSNPDNLRDLPRIQKEHQQLSDPALTSQVNTDKAPAVIWMGYTVHGNEASGLNAVPLVAYYLAAAQGAAVEELLNRSVVLLDLCVNPDGAARFAHWVNTQRGSVTVTDPQHREHTEAWPSGRFNHYWFDPNREWMPLQHPEARARLVRYHEWKPNVLTDHHEMGGNSTFFFQPGAPTRNNPNTPAKVYELTSRLARFHAERLDSIGSLYFTKEAFDDYYVGKGSSYPDITGGVGILFEQASSRGHAQTSEHGILTFASAIRNHVSSSLSTMFGALSMRKDLLEYQRNFAVTALQEAEKATVKGYVFGGTSDPARLYHFLDIVRRHQIVVHELAKKVTVDGKTFEPGSAYYIPAGQVQHRLLTTLFERRTTFTDSIFYDISSWTLPYAFHIPFAEFKLKPAPDIIGKTLDVPVFPKARVLESAATPPMYMLEWKGYYAPRALNRLLYAGIIVKTATKPATFTLMNGEKKSFAYGSLLIATGIQANRTADIKVLLEIIAREDGITSFAVKSGLAEQGIDAGSRNFATLEKPRTLMLIGSGVAPTDAGEIWHLMDYRMQMEVSFAELTSLGRLKLDRYNTIIMPGGSYNALDKNATEALKQWVEEGGVLIATEEATGWLVRQEWLKMEQRKPKAEKEMSGQRRAYMFAEPDNDAQNLDGAIFEAQLDLSHPIGYGYETATIPIFRSNKLFFDPMKNLYATPVVYSGNPLLSGYIHKEQEKLLKNAGDVFVGSLRSGKVIGFTSNPTFRAFWFGTHKLFLNAVFFGRLISNSTTQPGGKE